MVDNHEAISAHNNPPSFLQVFSRLSDCLLWRRAIAEFIGTMILVFTSSTAAIIEEQTGGEVTLVGLAACGGLAVMLLIVSTAHISGAHLNPSVTVSFAFLGHFPWRQVPIYIFSQMAASMAAAILLKVIFHPTSIAGASTIPSGKTSLAFAMEFAIGFNLMFVATAVSDSKAVKELAAIAVGATVGLNALIAGKISGASSNPARTFGPAVVTNEYKAIWVYFTAPVLGALTGAAAYTIIKNPSIDNRLSLSEV